MRISRGLALGASADDQLHTLWPALGLGVLAAGFAGALTSLLHRRAEIPVRRAHARTLPHVRIDLQKRLGISEV